MNEDLQAAIDAARARVAQQVANAEARRATIHAVSEQIKEISETARSRRGEVAVTAQPSGRVVSVEFSSAAQGVSPRELTTIVTATVASAQHQAAMRALELSAANLGEDSTLVAELRSEAQAAFPAPPTSGDVTWTG